MYILHHWPDSASTILRLILDELNQPYDCRLIDRPGGALDSAGYRAMNPLGQIPALETPDGPMFESAAMLLYLCDRHPGLAPAPDSPDRARFLKWLFFTNFNIHTTMLHLYYPDRIAGPAAVEAVKAQARIHLARMMDVLESAGPEVLNAREPTALGYYIAVLMRWIARDVASRAFPNLHAMLRYLENRPVARAVAQAESLGVTIFSQPG